MLKIQTVLLLAFFMSLPFTLLTQEEEKEKEKKVTIKIIKEVDGKKIVTDTTFTVTDEDDVKKIVKKYTMSGEGDSTGQMMVDVMVDVDEDTDWDISENKKVIVIKEGGDEERIIVSSHGGQTKVIKFKSGDGDDEKIIIVSPHGQHKVIKWTSEDGEDFEFDYDVDMEHFHEQMAEMDAHMKEMHIEILDEKGRLHDEIIKLKCLEELQHIEGLEHLEELERLKEMEVIVVPPAPHAPHAYNDFTWHHKGSMEVSDEELRDAGIKNKPDRLEPEEIDINNDDGVIDLSFTLKEEGAPKVTVYNIYGDKVFSGKPELMNNKYQLRMDMSKKQHGNYYLMIVLGNSSKTMRLKL